MVLCKPGQIKPHSRFKAEVYILKNFTCTVHSTQVELRTVFVVERSVTTTFFFLQDINLSFEARVRFNLTWFTKNHTTFDFVLVNTTEQHLRCHQLHLDPTSLRNISTPVTTDFLSSPKPRISTSSPTWNNT